METLSKKESESASEVAFSKCSPPSRMHARQNVWSTNGKHRQGCVFSRVVINSPSRRGQAAAGARWQPSRCPPPHEVSSLARASGTYHQWCRYEHHHHPYSVSWQTQRQAGGRGCGPPCLAPPPRQSRQERHDAAAIQAVEQQALLLQQNVDQAAEEREFRGRVQAQT